MNTKNNLKGSAILCLAALIWGLAFVAQSDGADKVPSFLFSSLRSFVGAAFLFVLLLLRSKKKPIFPKDPPSRRTALIAGAVCGVLLTIGVNFQQFGLACYPDGVAAEARGGFLTALYVIFVPLFSFFLGKKVSLPVLGAALIAVGGIYLLCLSGGIDGFYLGDLLLLFCSVGFTAHILTIDRFGEVDGILLSMMQFCVCGVLSGILALIFETPVWSDVLSATFNILYVGIMSSGVAYTLQIYGQKFASPPIASLSMSLESVFAALGGWVILGNTLTLREFIGCALVFTAIILAQIPSFFANRKKEN